MTANFRHADILSVREASRKIVRDLDFMRPTLAATDRVANLRVGRALHALSANARHGAVEGLRAYATALEIDRQEGAMNSTPDIEIVAGFQPGATALRSRWIRIG